MADVIDADGDLENADWLRSLTWDIWTIEKGTYTLVHTYEQLVDVIAPFVGNAAETKIAIQAFLRLPAARPMPEELKSDLRKRGYTI